MKSIWRLLLCAKFGVVERYETLRSIAVRYRSVTIRYGTLRERYGAVTERYRTDTENIDFVHH